MKSYNHVLTKLYETPWLILPESLELIISIVERKLSGESLTEEQLLEIGGAKQDNELVLPNKPSVGVLNIAGPIFPKANLMTQMSGATSIDALQKDFNTMMGSDMVTSIVLNIDSPGGSADMIKEMADVIYAARQMNIKPIHAVANPTMASAAYYLGSQANKMYATPSALVGSIGVVAVHTDTTAQDEKDGIKRTVLSVGKYKADGNPHEALSDTAKEHFLELMNETYTEFVNDVARGRNIDPQTVLEDYGQGRAYKVRTALKRGMVDGVKTLDASVSELAQPSSQIAVSMDISTNGKERTMPEYTPETLTLLGLSEDATTEDVTVAIEAIKVKADAKPEVITAELISVESDFAKQYPEQAAEIARLRETDRKNSAKMYAGQYAQFTSDKGSSGMGFSSLALGLVEELHLKIADGVVTHADLTSFLDNVASGNAVVNYTEVGSTRGHEELSAENGYDAATQIRDLAYEMVASDGLSYGDAVSRVLAENTELASLYRNSIPSGGE